MAADVVCDVTGAVFALRSRWGVTALTAVAAMMLGNLNMWSYFTKTLGMPGPHGWVSSWHASVVFAAGILLFRVLVCAVRCGVGFSLCRRSG